MLFPALSEIGNQNETGTPTSFPGSSLFSTRGKKNWKGEDSRIEVAGPGAVWLSSAARYKDEVGVQVY